MGIKGLVWSFFHIPGNQMLVAFGHGLVYFLMGFAVLLQSRQRRHASDLTLARSLPWLGMFGVVQALAAWGSTFVPIQQAFLSVHMVRLLYTVQTFLVATASALLLHFGTRLWADTRDYRDTVKRGLFVIAPLCFLIWAVLYVGYTIRIPADAIEDLLAMGQIVARYSMAIPGSIITCIALVLQAREFELLRMSHLVAHLKWLTLSFALHAVSSFMLIPPASFGFAARINSEVFLRWTGLPIDVLSGLAGLLMTIFAVRILEVFDIELGRRLDAARHMKLLLDERDRIARELHDGTIQSLYSIGLTLEAALFSLESSKEKTKNIVTTAMERLDNTIQDMRTYIMDIKGYAEHADLIELLRALVDQLADEYDIRIDLDYKPHDASHLSDEDRRHILQIVRESVSNASRHGKASTVSVRLKQQDGLRLLIEDDGVGFDANQVWREHFDPEEQRVHHGLRNMLHRAELLGGYFEVKSEIGKGTQIIVTLPEQEVDKNE